jgi:CRISPR-associated protein Cmr6
LIGFAGSDTILENSLSLHPYYGFPVIPGPSLKGITRHYCREYEGLPDDAMLRIFGNESEEKEAKEGEVVFFDAWPERWPSDGKGLLELDVMSPHYSEYYSQKKFPSDDQDPIPIVFLAIRKGIDFRFCLVPSRVCKDINIVRLGKCYLEKALKTFGAGAKTGSSYGYFE